jgi:hypothetical protein
MQVTWALAKLQPWLLPAPGLPAPLGPPPPPSGPPLPAVLSRLTRAAVRRVPAAASTRDLAQLAWALAELHAAAQAAAPAQRGEPRDPQPRSRGSLASPRPPLRRLAPRHAAAAGGAAPRAAVGGRLPGSAALSPAAAVAGRRPAAPAGLPQGQRPAERVSRPLPGAAGAAHAAPPPHAGSATAPEAGHDPLTEALLAGPLLLSAAADWGPVGEPTARGRPAAVALMARPARDSAGSGVEGLAEAAARGLCASTGDAGTGASGLGSQGVEAAAARAPCEVRPSADMLAQAGHSRSGPAGQGPQAPTSHAASIPEAAASRASLRRLAAPQSLRAAGGSGQDAEAQRRHVLGRVLLARWRQLEAAAHQGLPPPPPLESGATLRRRRAGATAGAGLPSDGDSAHAAQGSRGGHISAGTGRGRGPPLRRPAAVALTDVAVLCGALPRLGWRPAGALAVRWAVRGVRSPQAFTPQVRGGSRGVCMAGSVQQPAKGVPLRSAAWYRLLRAARLTPLCARPTRA